MSERYVFGGSGQTRPISWAQEQADKQGVSLERWLSVHTPEGVTAQQLGQAEVTLAPRVEKKGPAQTPRTTIRKNHGLSQTVRRLVFERDKGLCRYCGKQLRFLEKSEKQSDHKELAYTIDHVLPWSRGGTNELTNLVSACYSCNMKKKSHTPEECGMIVWPIGATYENMVAHIAKFKKEP